jgi:hypothetical protein
MRSMLSLATRKSHWSHPRMRRCDGCARWGSQSRRVCSWCATEWQWELGSAQRFVTCTISMGYADDETLYSGASSWAVLVANVPSECALRVLAHKRRNESQIGRRFGASWRLGLPQLYWRRRWYVSCRCHAPMRQRSCLYSQVSCPQRSASADCWAFPLVFASWASDKSDEASGSRPLSSHRLHRRQQH